MANKDKELYLQAQRRLVASLVYDGSDATRVFELVNPSDVAEPALELVISSIMDLARKDEVISPVSIANELKERGQLKQAGGISELNTLRLEGQQYKLEAPTEIYAGIVKESSMKNKMSELLTDYKDSFKDDSGMSAVEAVSSLQSELNNALYTLSDDATMTDVTTYMKDYFAVLDERLQISIENEDRADGLQGIPSLVPSLNKYTSGWQPQQLITIGARTGVGKALALTTPIPTPDGWTTMGDLKIGDEVIGRDGKATKVVNATEIQLNRKTFEIVFDNGEKIVADADHRWITRTLLERKANIPEKVRTTAEIVESLKEGSGSHTIKVTEPVEFEKSELPIEPYTLGYWLGNGGIIGDERREAEIAKYLGDFDVPISYMRASISQRQELLAGFLDAAGGIDDDGFIYFESDSYAIVEAFSEILASLGNIVYREVDGIHTTLKFKAVSYPFKNGSKWGKVFTPRAEDESYHIIVEIREVESVPVRCIQVDNSDHMYLAGHTMIPTHNTVFAIMSVVAAARAGKSVLFFSLEMSHPEIIDRIVACMSGVSMSKLKQGRLTPDEMELVHKAQEEFKEMKITIDTDPKATVDAIRSKAFKAAQSPKGLDIIILDYLQLVTPVGRHTSRQEAVSDISRNMKLTAKSLNIPIMVLVQLNRAKGDEEDDKLPTLDNIRESGAIAMDSDVVILLHRDVAHDDTTPQTIVILEKNRNGESQKLIRCHSNLECSLFREIKREKEASERLTEEDMEDLEDDIDLSDFEGLDDDIEFGDDF